MSDITYLFVPATRVDRVTKAFDAGADAVIVDLEDAVDAADKDAARQALAAHLPGSTRPVWVRVNARSTPWFDADMALMRSQAGRVAGVMLSKTESAEDLDAVGASLPVIALVESARGMLTLGDIASHASVRRLAFGSADLSKDLGCADDRAVLAPARLQVVLHSAAHGLAAPIDGVTFAIDDAVQIAADAEAAARAGFGAKLCIHPRQVQAVAQGFAPSAASVAWARQVLEFAAAGSGARRMNGEMIDKPVIERAEQILARHRAGRAAGQPVIG